MASDRLRQASREVGEPAEMDMSPMIDMVFLLLLFFLVVSNPKTIKIDPTVKPPVAKYAGAADTLDGKIVINIHNDGSYSSEGGQKLAEGDQLLEYLKKEKDKVKSEGHEPVLHIRADAKGAFKLCQKVMKSGSKAGIQLMAHGAYNKPAPSSR